MPAPPPATSENAWLPMTVQSCRASSYRSRPWLVLTHAVPAVPADATPLPSTTATDTEATTAPDSASATTRRLIVLVIVWFPFTREGPTVRATRLPGLHEKASRGVVECTRWNDRKGEPSPVAGGPMAGDVAAGARPHRRRALDVISDTVPSMRLDAAARTDKSCDNVGA